jgi:two-component system phosphate regulon response regulator OmpR
MNKNIFHILVVDDDDRIRELVKQYLEENNFLVTTAIDAFDAKNKLDIIKFDILILDIMMPGKSGLSLTNEIKKVNSTPIILLTAKGETADRIKGLELGADDYLGKPFEPKELLLRIKNILNKIQKPLAPNEIYIGGALVNLKKLNININNKTIKINPQEKKILGKMLEEPGKIFSRDDIGKIINISKERTIDVMITRLRQKIESNPKNPKYLQTIRGSGYVLWIE